MCHRDELQQKAYDKFNEKTADAPKFIKDFFKSKPKLRSKQSFLAYWNNFRQFLEYLVNNEIVERLSISEITKEDMKLIKKTHIDQYLIYCRDEKKNADVTLNFKLNSLRSLFSYFVDDDIIIKNVTNNVEINKPEKKPLKYATPEDVKELIHNLESMKNEYDMIRNIAIVQLLFGSGVRITELVGLDISDLHLDDEIPNMSVHRKGGKIDIVDISQDAKMSLEEYLLIRDERVTDNNNNILFLSERKNAKSQRLSSGTISDFIRVYSDGKLNPHMFRKGLGMLIYNNSGDLHMAAEQLGHSSDQTTGQWYVTTDRTRRSNVMNGLNKNYNEK